MVGFSYAVTHTIDSWGAGHKGEPVMGIQLQGSLVSPGKKDFLKFGQERDFPMFMECQPLSPVYRGCSTLAHAHYKAPDFSLSPITWTNS